MEVFLMKAAKDFPDLTTRINCRTLLHQRYWWSGRNGIISPLGIYSVAANANKTYSITPSNGYPGYHIDSVFIDGINVGPYSQYTIANITSNKTISVKFGLNDTTKYRSFKSDSLLSLKSISLKRKAGQSALLPLKANWRDTVIFRYGGKRNHSRIAQTDKVLANNSSWVRYGKGGDMAKFYTAMQSDSMYNAPLDGIRYKLKNLKVNEKFKPAAKHIHRCWEFGVFKLNLYSSKQELRAQDWIHLCIGLAEVVDRNDAFANCKPRGYRINEICN